MDQTSMQSVGAARFAMFLTLSMLLGSGIAAGQEGSTLRPAFRLDADLYRFQGTDSLVFVELAYGLSEAALTYRHDSTGFNGAVEMNLEVRGGGGTPASRHWIVQRAIPDTLANLSAKNILSIETMTLRPGSYVAVLTCRDQVDSMRLDSVVIPFLAGVGQSTEVGLSDIELCSRISPSTDRSSLFYKNTLEVIPNPARLYGEGLSVLHFYVEVYNLLAAGTGDVILAASILDASGRPIVARSKTKPRANNSSVEYGSMNIASLPAGSYTLRISVEDSASTPPRILARAEKRLFLYRSGTEPALATGPTSGSAGVFDFMTAGEIDDEIRKIAYISAEPERDQIETIVDSVAKRNFLQNFWAGRDPDGSTIRNEARDEYLRRIAIANEQYREKSRPGWLTDRGRVLILYGPPDDVERHPNESEAHPYQIWMFNAVQGGVQFIFVDKLGFGEYRQVHSSHRDELRNDDWYGEEVKIH